MNRLITIISIVTIIASLSIIGFMVYQNYQPLVASSAKVAQSVVDFFPQAASRLLSSPNGSSTQFIFNPFGGGANQSVSVPEAPLLEKISPNPVASFSLLKSSAKTETLVYIEKDSGNIFSLKIVAPATSTSSSTPNTPIRISNLTIPAVFDAYFGFDQAKNVQALVRFPDKNRRLQIISLSIEPNTGSTTASSTNPWLVKTAKLSPNIYNLAVSPDQSTVLYLENIGTRAIAYTAGFKLQNKKLMLVTPFSDWEILWSATNTAYFYPRPSADYRASLYTLNLKDRSFKKTINSINGLTALPAPGNQHVVYANSFGNDFSLLVHSNKTGVNSDLFLKTLPEKCLWDNNLATLFCAVPRQLSPGLYPDDWYLGKKSFSDALWMVYPELGKTSQLHAFSGPNENFDIISLKQDSAHNFYFIDKKTWALYRLNSSRLFE